MPVITISRGSYSRGKEVAERLAEALNYECISREILVNASDQFNIPEIKLKKALHDAPTVLGRFSNGPEKYMSFFKTSLLSWITKGNIVYHGLAGHFFLQDISHVLKVRINARMEDRVREEMRRENSGSVDQVQFNLKKDDEERRRWSLNLYGKDTWDSRLYDMVLCVDSLTVDDIVEIILKTIRKKHFQETEESVAELQRRAMLADIESQLIALSPKTRVTLSDEKTIELSGVNGKLKNGSTQEDFSNKMKSQFNIQQVLYREAVAKGHINNFHNIDVQ
ncbi:AAA family ATPase [Desulfopila sp. IMCC35008]|uniref:cytidylate kinase-like family protein n=1 Tax=Desulfopila sp. IMCC35008 TaxID=2653858 RepID=UPI0013D7E19C|nr:cytidylate kinase-like family protein [Desulfopila sp. IMCC35008]